jgi:hypothetical protein
MSTFPNSPRLLKGGLVLIDAASGRIVRTIVLQYNAETLGRTLTPQAVTADGQDRSQALRIKAPAIETLKLEAAIDATDQLEFPDLNASAVAFGIQPQLATLEMLIHPPSARLIANNVLANVGTLEIAPVEAPLPLFIWSKSRVAPVRVTDLSITEEAFDAALNPIRARVTLGLRVLTVNDLGFEHRGGGVFMAYLQAKEQIAQRARSGALAELGLGRLP